MKDFFGGEMLAQRTSPTRLARMFSMATLRSTPAADGCRMPGEFEPHRGCWMLWPERPDNWRNAAQPAQRAFAAVARAIARFEPVTVGASSAQIDRARALLGPRVRAVALESDDAWMRDVGPTCVVTRNGVVRGVDWRFNAWGGFDGGLYFPWDRDARVARRVLEIEGLQRYRAPLICEGGAIHSDGAGTLLVTEQCLLNPNRNPTFGKRRIENLLKAYTGARVVIWLGAGVFADETSGHIDNLACFASPGCVLLGYEENPRDPMHRISVDAYERLMEARDARGERLRVIKLPMPGPLHMSAREAAGVQRRRGAKPRRAGQRLAASYVNFYLANGALVMPLLDARKDAVARRILRRAFPTRRIVGVAAREILLGGGNIHCITQQIPRGGRR